MSKNKKNPPMEWEEKATDKSRFLQYQKAFIKLLNKPGKRKTGR